jgi:glyoxylase-like metal-dependent hydrolase (beta-lactamase superfamily II)/poly(3-hydroxybutyrate) depolymerase
MHPTNPPSRCVPILATLAILVSPAAAAASPSAKVVAAAAAIAPRFQSATHHAASGSSLPYRYFAPSASAGAAARRPLVLFLHGEEAAGTDNLAQLTTSEGATIWVEPDHLAKNPTYVLAPQAPRGADWGREPVYSGTVELLKQFVASRPDVDPDRIYVVGFSMGGTGAWTMLLRNPGLFAAAIPISGNANAFLSDEKAFAGIRNTPVLPVHSYDDPLSPVSGTQNAVDAMVAAGDQSVSGSSQIWGMGAVVPAHDAWLPAFHNYEVIYNWLFDQSLARTNHGVVAPSSLYTLRDLGSGVAQIWDYYLGTVYVIERSDKALVIDTGMGTDNLYEFIRQRVLRNKSIDLEIAVTHDHFDHLSGLASFVGVPQLKKIYVHQEDSALVERFMKQDAGKIQFVADGDQIPLGGGSVKVVHVPGHTPGSVVYWYESNLYTGDAVGSGDLWMGFTPMSIEEYVGSVRHLLAGVGDNKLTVLPGHTGECRSPLGVEYLRQLLACATGLVDGSLRGTPYRRTVGGQASLGHAATVGRATIVHDLNNVHATTGALRSLAVGTGSLSPSFRPYRFFYSVSVGSDVAVETITPVAMARDARTVSINGESLEKGATFKAPLQAGRNAFSVVVTTADGMSRRYQLTVNRGSARFD